MLSSIAASLLVVYAGLVGPRHSKHGLEVEYRRRRFNLRGSRFIPGPVIGDEGLPRVPISCSGLESTTQPLDLPCEWLFDPRVESGVDLIPAVPDPDPSADDCASHYYGANDRSSGDFQSDAVVLLTIRRVLEVVDQFEQTAVLVARTARTEGHTKIKH